MVICLELGADLHMAQLMPLPLTVFCFSKMQIGFLPFWYRFTRVVLEKGPLNGCVYVCHVWCKLYLCICRCIIIMEICGIFYLCSAENKNIIYNSAGIEYQLFCFIFISHCDSASVL